MEIPSKIIVPATDFAAALKAAIAVAPTKGARLDLVQFRIVGESLFIGARTHTETFVAEVQTEYIDAHDRDTAFEISRAEAIALSAMKMAKEESEEEPRLGLLIGEKFVQRTDESGLGLGLRNVKVRRSDEPYQPFLGDIPDALSRVAMRETTSQNVLMAPEQWQLVAKVAKALDVIPQARCISKADAPVAQTFIYADHFSMSVICSMEDGEPEGSEKGEQSDLGDLVKQAVTEVVVETSQTVKKLAANPPKGIA